MEKKGIIVLTLLLVAFIAELIWSKIKKKNVYNLKDTLANFSIMLGANILKPLFLLWQFFIFTFIEPYKIYTLPNNFVVIVTALYAVEFVGYWYHRLSHEVPFLWTIHHAHHSSRWFNLSTALRLNWLGKIVVPLFYVPLVIVGFSAEVVIGWLAVSLFYQLFLHTEAIGTLGKFEGLFFNTPSAHRVHHGYNANYIDKNYGGLLIIYDRIFGTYQAEVENVQYGVTTGFMGHNPFKILFSPLMRWLRS